MIETLIEFILKNITGLVVGVASSALVTWLAPIIAERRRVSWQEFEKIT